MADGSKQPEAVCLFVGKRKHGRYGPWYYWQQVEQPRKGTVMIRDDVQDLPDTRRVALYQPADAKRFARAVPISEKQYEAWPDGADRLADRFYHDAKFLIETVERVSANHLVCRVWMPASDDPPELCVGDKGWEVASYANDSLTYDKARGRRAFLTLDCVGVWEIHALLRPLVEGEPLRIEIVRQKGMVFPGVNTVLSGGLDFVADKTVRNSIEAKVRGIERDLDTDRDAPVTMSCASVADELIVAVAEQHLTTGKTFGAGDSVITTLAKLPKAKLNQRIDAFFSEFESSELGPKLKRFQAPLHSLRHWSNVPRHARGSKKINKKDLIEPDEGTVWTCYGALRDFIRALQAVHKKDPSLLVPEAVPTSQAAKP